ncbi:MAG: DUF2892 domain-containing protein [Halieaceae bacterium]|jgi:hypothetical protein|nr:DUF2892 domain-containing protein [Halieaceae bacterium]
MIERNIGVAERIIRLILGVALITWVLTASSFHWPQGLALVAAFALLWNSIFARCYLWKWLRISTCSASGGECALGTTRAAMREATQEATRETTRETRGDGHSA